MKEVLEYWIKQLTEAQAAYTKHLTDSSTDTRKLQQIRNRMESVESRIVAMKTEMTEYEADIKPHRRNLP